MALTSIGLMTMPLTPCTTAASTSAVCLGAEFWPSDSTVLTPSALPSSCIAFIMWTKNGKFRPGTEVITVTSCARAVAGAERHQPRHRDAGQHRPASISPLSNLPGATAGRSGAGGGGDGRAAPVACQPLSRLAAGDRIGHTAARRWERIMDKRQLGRSDLRVAPLCLGGNVFGWTADEETSFRLLDRALEAGLDFIDTADVYSVWVPGHRGGESEAIIGEWLDSRRCRDRVVIATKVGADMGDGRKGLAPARIRDGGRGLAAAAADRPHRPLPGALRRPGDAARGDAGRVRRADRRGQGAGDRRLEPHAGAAARGAGGQRGATGCRATRACSRTTISTTARATRPSWSRSASSTALGVISYFGARQGLPHRQVPHRGRPRAEPARRRRRGLSERARPAHPGGAGRGRGRASARRRRRWRWPG